MKAPWNDVLTEASIQVGDEHWMKGNRSSESGTRGFEILIEQYPELDSIFIDNDQIALGVIRIARQKGLMISESAYFCPH